LDEWVRKRGGILGEVGTRRVFEVRKKSKDERRESRVLRNENYSLLSSF